jgi:uncharacterized OsmC-like protein
MVTPFHRASRPGIMNRRDHYQRKVRTLTERPAFARESSTSLARLAEGLACEVRSGDHLVGADMPQREGGTGAAPTPGQLMRSGLAACLAIGYRLWSERLEIPVGAIEVEVTCDIDARGQLGIAPEVPARWQRIAYTVRLTSGADPADLARLVDHADRLSPMLDALDKSITLERTLEVTR